MFKKDYTSNMTKEFLHQISKHLSFRKEFSSWEYVVEIGSDEVRCYPNPLVFSSRYDRRPETKESLIAHVMKRHLGVKSIEDITVNSCKFEPSLISLNPGVYRYMYSITKKSRKWFKTL